MGRAWFSSHRPIWVVAGLLPPAAITVATHGFPHDAAGWGAFAQLMAIAIVVLGAMRWYAGQRVSPERFNRELPEGSTVTVDTGDDWIGMGYAGCYTGVTGRFRTREIASTRVVYIGFDRLFAPTELLEHDGEAVDPAAPQPDSSYITGTAHAGLADRLSRASRSHPGYKIAVAALVLYPPVVWAVLYGRSGTLSAADIAAPTAISVVSLALIGYLTAIAIPRYHRRLVPAGTPIAADFGPRQIGLRLGDRTDLIAVDAIKRVRPRGTMLALRASTRNVELLIPRELVSDQVAQDLLSRFGPGR